MPRVSPTDRRLAEQLRDGGFSESIDGRKPRSGVMVSDVGGEQVIEGRSATPEDIAQYRAQHRIYLDQPGVYFGGWMDGGNAYLDRSRRFPEGEQARHAASANKQLSSYDVSHGTFPDTDPTIFPLEPNVAPVWPRYRRRDQITGELRRRQNNSRIQQLRLPGM